VVSVAKYTVKRRGPPSQGWRTFLRNHAAMDLFVVPTISFDLLYAFVIVRLGRWDLVWIVSPSAAVYADRAFIADLATKAHLPSIFYYRESVELGGFAPQ